MARQFGQERTPIGSVHHLDRIADGAMKLPASGNPQLVIEGHANQVVRELVATRGHLLDNVRRHRLVERL